MSSYHVHSAIGYNLRDIIGISVASDTASERINSTTVGSFTSGTATENRAKTEHAHLLFFSLFSLCNFPIQIGKLSFPFSFFFPINCMCCYLLAFIMLMLLLPCSTTMILAQDNSNFTLSFYSHCFSSILDKSSLLSFHSILFVSVKFSFFPSEN